MECYCFLRNVHDKMGKTAFQTIYGKKFDGPSIPFGTLVEYIPMTAKDEGRIRLDKNAERIILGPRATCGEEERGSCDLMIADFEDVQESEVTDIYVKRWKNQEVFVKGNCDYPCANGTPKLPGRHR